jgi:radical SAM-linked protein
MGDAVQRWRIVFGRGEQARDLDQRRELEAWESAVLESGLPTSPAGARPKLAFALPLPGGMDADAERFDVGLVERRTRAEVRSALGPRVPVGHRLIDLHDVWIGEPALPGRVVAADYRLFVGPATPEDLRPIAEGLLAASTIPRIRRRGERETTYDLRPLIRTLGVEPPAPGDDGDAVVSARLVVSPSGGAGRPDEVVAAMEEAAGRSIRLLGGRRERIWLADELVGGPLVG